MGLAACNTITKPEQAQQKVDERLAEGSDYIKVFYNKGPRFPAMPKPLREAIVKGGAHKRGQMVVVHGTSLDIPDRRRVPLHLEESKKNDIRYNNITSLERTADCYSQRRSAARICGQLSKSRTRRRLLLAVEKDHLVFHPPKLGAAKMDPVANGGWLGWCVKFARGANGRVSGSLLDSARTYNPKLVRMSQ